MLGNLHYVLPQDAPWNQVVLRIGSIVKHKVLAEVRAAFQTEVAFVARRRICSNDTHARLEAVTNGFPDLFDNTGQFVAEQRGRSDHPSMVALFPYLEIGAKRERS